MKRWEEAGKKAGIVLFWLLLWQVAAIAVGNRILLAGPADVAAALAEQVTEGEFWATVFCSLARITCGFLLAFVLGIGLGAAAFCREEIRTFLEPMVFLIKSTPVASFVVLLLIWFGANWLSALISFLVVFPMVYYGVLAGAAQTDKKLLEMARVYGMSVWLKGWYLYRPAVMPSLTAACRTALGMAWKSGVAAEVIGTPDHSIGEKLYLAKITLGTAELFAWTLVIIGLCFLFERAVLAILCAVGKERPGTVRTYVRRRTTKREKESRREYRPDTQKEAEEESELVRACLKKSYGENCVIRDFTIRMKRGERIGLMAPSGAGKTTLFRLLLGLEQSEGGGIERELPIRAVVFQEDRLCENLTAVDNVCLVSGKNLDREQARRELLELLPQEAVDLPVSALSGGMKRRAALVRAITAESELVLLDEPFTGLDEESRERAIRYVRLRLRGRGLILASHEREDFRRMGMNSVLISEGDGRWEKQEYVSSAHS